jgi:hypothetical protein
MYFAANIAVVWAEFKTSLLILPRAAAANSRYFVTRLDERDEIASPHTVPQPECHTLSYRHGKAVLCITAKSARQWQIRVMSVELVSFAFPLYPHEPT